MAFFRSLEDKNTGLLIKPLNYKERAEHWFLFDLSYFKEDKKIKFIKATFHSNDFVNLINNINCLLVNEISEYSFEPLEPYLRMSITHKKDSYQVAILLNAGPIFNDQNYERYVIYLSANSLEVFVKDLIEEIKQIDPQLSLKPVNI